MTFSSLNLFARVLRETPSETVKIDCDGNESGGAINHRKARAKKIGMIEIPAISFLFGNSSLSIGNIRQADLKGPRPS